MQGDLDDLPVVVAGGFQGAEIEAHLKTQLLNRTSRRVTLTDAAQAYIQACRRILDDLDEAERVVSGEYRAPQGELTVTASMVLGRIHVVPVAAAFLKAYPDILLRLRLNDRVVSLQEEHVDLGGRIGALPDSDIVAPDRIGATGGVRKPRLSRAPGSSQNPGRSRGARRRLLHRLHAFNSLDFSLRGTVTAVPIRPRLQIDGAEAVVEAALAGSGIIRLFSYHVAEAVKNGRLSLLLEEFEPPPRPVNLVYLGGGLLPLKVRAFLDLAAPRLKARLEKD